MSLMKKQTAGIWASLVTLIFAIVACIIYNVNIHSEGYFQNAAVPYATGYTVLAMVLLAAAVILANLPIKGIAEKLIIIIADAMRIVCPALFIAAAVTQISARVEGFAFIYFSNEEVLQEVQTAANMSSSHGAIATIVALMVTAIIGMVAAFFSIKKKED